ncbi:MAG: hypothetical protein Fur0010_05210 [Bdellovibrio sp.]
MQEYWLSIDDYSRVHKISISTIRRRIKSNEFEFKMENGKYLIKSEIDSVPNIPNFSYINTIKELESKIHNLKKEMVDIIKENEDLKTLIAFYESKNTENIPNLELERF